MYLARNLQDHLQGHIGSEKDHLYSTIDRELAGFRPGSSCVVHINTLQSIIEQSAEYRFDLHLVFVDFEKAFDSGDGEALLMALMASSANLEKASSTSQILMPMMSTSSAYDRGMILL